MFQFLTYNPRETSLKYPLLRAKLGQAAQYVRTVYLASFVKLLRQQETTDEKIENARKISQQPQQL